jgi:hypothetical protein
MTRTPDHLDVLLTDSAPAKTSSSPTLRHDLAVMAAEAKTASRLRRRPLRVAASPGRRALLGRRARTPGDWAPWAQDPDLAYPFILPSGRACEARVAVYDIESIDSNGAITRSDPANDSDFARHLRDLDLVDQADVQASITEVRQRDTSVSYVAVLPDGQLEDVHATTSGPTEDDIYAAAVSNAVRDVINAEAATFDGGHDYTADESILCEKVAP